MDAVRFTDPRDFSDRVRPIVEQDPVGCNFLASWVEIARKTSGSRDDDGPADPYVDALWLLLIDGDRSVGAAMHTPPYPLVLSPVPRRRETEAADALVDVLSRHQRAVRGVVGDVDAARAFTQAWTQRTGVSARVAMSERMYSLTEVKAPVEVPGNARRAAEADLPLLARWMADFAAEAEPGDEVDAEAMARRKLTQGFLVAGAHQCMLYTDLANATSNAIYQALGYRPVRDAVKYTFTS
jgi:hypothetical protein